MPDGLGAPANPYPRAGLRAIRAPAVEGVEQRRVGAIQAHERPGERVIQGMRAQGLDDPRRVHDHARRGDVDRFADVLAGVGVVLERRDEHVPPAVRTPTTR